MMYSLGNFKLLSSENYISVRECFGIFNFDPQMGRGVVILQLIGSITKNRCNWKSCVFSS